jgi:mannose-6-phosphate isomerase-like protein (cupin superfamily)
LTRPAAAITISRDITVRLKEQDMTETTTGVKVVGPADGTEGFLGSIGVRFMIDGPEAGERFSLVEHPMSARALAAPLHRHTREDEYSFVLSGRMGALLGDDVVEAGPGDLVFKPRNQWHTFWNAGDEPCRILEIISPAGFERFFRELNDLGGALNADPEALAELNERYGQEMRPDSVPELLERFGLRIGEQLSGGWTPTAPSSR